jgi:predicted Zn-dependent protease
LFKTDFQNDDNTELKRILSRMRIDASNLANVMYQNKSYEMASQAFEMSYELYFDMTSMYDTISWNNACIAALNSKNTTRSKRFLEHGITQQWDQISFYSMLSRLYLEQGDTNQALQWLTNGRSRYPSDLGLISEETNLYIAQKNISQAKTNLQLAISKAPQQSNLILVLANILDNEVQQLQVGPGMPAYDTLWKATEALYLKAFQLLPERSDQQFALLFNLGALYNNHAVKWSQLKTPKGQNALQFSKQIEQQAAVFLNKALPYLERALTIKPDDEAVKRALKQIYLKTGKADKAKML